MAVKSKIRSQRGATLMAALLFFLVAAVCGSIILAAATATLSRVKNQAKDAQAYYAVTSAAQLIRDDLMDSIWRITFEERYSLDASENLTVNTEVKSIKLQKIQNGKLGDLTSEEEKNTFVSDFISQPATVITSMVKDSEITISLPTLTGFPVIYAKAKDNLPFKTNDVDVEKNGCTLKLIITNRADGGDSKFTSYKETDDSGNQLYWVTVSLRSVTIPGGYQIESDARNEDGVGVVKRSICLGWADPVIEKVRVQ